MSLYLKKYNKKTIGLLQKQKITVKKRLINSLISPCLINDSPIPVWISQINHRRAWLRNGNGIKESSHHCLLLLLITSVFAAVTFKHFFCEQKSINFNDSWKVLLNIYTWELYSQIVQIFMIAKLF